MELRVLPSAAIMMMLAVTPAHADVAAASSSDTAQAAAGIQVSGKSLIAILQPSHHPLYELFTERFKAQGRFDYVPIGYRNDTRVPGARQFISTFRSYLKQNAGMITSKDAKPDFKFGDAVITGEDLDKLVTSAYVMLPRWSYSPVVLLNEATHEEKDGSKEYSIEANSVLSLSNEIVNVETGLVLAEQGGFWPVSKRLSVKIPAGASSDERKEALRGFEAEKALAQVLPPEQVMGGNSAMAAGLIMSQVMTAARRLDAFRLRTTLTADKSTGLKMVLGQKTGVEYDSAFEVFRKVKVGGRFDMQPAGFLKVRDMDANFSTIQPIQQSLGFEEGDQLVEHPQSGIDGVFRFGVISYDPTGGIWLNPALTVASEANLAPLLRSAALSETYLTADASFVIPDAAQGLVGIKKRVYSNQLVYSYGFKLGVLGAATTVGRTPSGLQSNGGTSITKGSLVHVAASAFGGGPSVGLEYQFNPDFKLGVDAALLLFSPVRPSKVTVTDRADSSRTYDFDLSQLPSGLTIPDGNASGLTLCLTGSYTF